MMHVMVSKTLTVNAAIIIISIFISPPSLVQSQQPYEGLYISNCENQHNSSSLLGYFCINGSSSSCRSFLTFHAQPPYDSVPSISSLLGSDPSQLSRLNSVPPGSGVFPANTKVIVPVTCSCSGVHYQANSTYVVRNQETDFTIANNRFQGLSSCQALKQQNSDKKPNGYLYAGMKITVPLRCACPTSEQRSNYGARYLMSYLVEPEETVFLISQRFGADLAATLDANSLSQENDNIYPFTTLLVPLNTQPNSSQLSNPSSSSPPPPPQTAPPSPPNGKKSNHAGLYVGVGVAVLFCLFAISSFLFYFRFKAKKNNKNASKATLIEDSGKADPRSSSELFADLGLSESVLLSISDIGQSLKLYKFGELQKATENFSSGCRIEGSVYRGIFNGDYAAVKIMNSDVSKEIEILKRINHFNLIRLSGLCFNHGNWYLVFEYAQNGSLSNWIFDRSGTMVLSWMKRLQIALDVANGLNYLHSYTDPPHVHKDVKSSNILLDGQFRGKIANFGLARPAEGKEGEFELTRHIAGTKGYMAPEYLEHGLISTKLDVYAFGVVMLEIITGRDAASMQKGEDGFSLKEFIAVVTDEENARAKLGSFIDPLIEGDYPLDTTFFMARLIEGCLRKDAGSRPSMGEIAQSLSILFASSLSTASSNSVSASVTS